MLLLAFAISLIQPAAGPGHAPAAPIPYLILADEARRARVERLLSELAGSGFRTETATESGLTYVGCVTSWRDNPSQATACIQSRLPRHGRPGTVVVNTYERSARVGDTLVTCIGAGGRETFVLRPDAAAHDTSALRACLLAASRDSGAPPPGVSGVRFARELEMPDAAEARAQAERVWTVAIDHVGVPRGVTGTCLVQGRVTDVVRGADSAVRGRIELGIPCAAGPHRGGPRRVAMHDIREGSFANIYLGDRQELLDFAPLTP